MFAQLLLDAADYSPRIILDHSIFTKPEKNNNNNSKLPNSLTRHHDNNNGVSPSIVAFITSTKQILQSLAPRCMLRYSLHPELESCFARILLRNSPATVRYAQELNFDQLNNDFLKECLSTCRYVQRLRFNYIFHRSYEIDLGGAVEEYLEPGSLREVSFGGIDTHHLGKFLGMNLYSAVEGFRRENRLFSSPAGGGTTTRNFVPLSLKTLEIHSCASISSQGLAIALFQLCVVKKTLQKFVLSEGDEGGPFADGSQLVKGDFFRFLGQVIVINSNDKSSNSEGSSLRILELHFPNYLFTHRSVRHLFFGFPKSESSGLLSTYYNCNENDKDDDDHDKQDSEPILTSFLTELSLTLPSIIDDELFGETKSEISRVSFPFLTRLKISGQNKVELTDEGGLHNLLSSCRDFGLRKLHFQGVNLETGFNNCFSNPHLQFCLRELILTDSCGLFSKIDDANNKNKSQSLDLHHYHHPLRILMSLESLQKLHLDNIDPRALFDGCYYSEKNQQDEKKLHDVPCEEIVNKIQIRFLPASLEIFELFIDPFLDVKPLSRPFMHLMFACFGCWFSSSSNSKLRHLKISQEPSSWSSSESFFIDDDDDIDKIPMFFVEPHHLTHHFIKITSLETLELVSNVGILFLRKWAKGEYSRKPEADETTVNRTPHGWEFPFLEMMFSQTKPLSWLSSNSDRDDADISSPNPAVVPEFDSEEQRNYFYQKLVQECWLKEEVEMLMSEMPRLKRVKIE